MHAQHPFSFRDTPHLRLVPSPASGTDGEAVYLEVVVPAFNEENRLGPSLQGIVEYLAAQPYSAAITVVDNGSVDRTADLVVEGGTHPVAIRVKGARRPGKGAAVRRGVLSADARYVGFSDADLSTPIETLDLILPQLVAGCPVVIASRKCPGAEYAVAQPPIRRLASRAFSKATRLCMAELEQIHDTQCGFKFFEATAARRVFEQSEATGFAFDVEILALSLMGGYDVMEVPARWEHVEGSAVSVSRDATKVLRELVAMRANLRTVQRAGFGPLPGVAWTGAGARPGVELDATVPPEDPGPGAAGAGQVSVPEPQVGSLAYANHRVSAAA